MFAESDAVGARLRNPSGGKPKKAVAARRKERNRMAAAKKRSRKSAKKTTPAKAKATKKRTRTVKKGARTKGSATRTSKVRVRGKQISRAVSTSIRNAKRKSVTYRKYKRGGAAIILRASNPTDQPKAVAAFVVGAIAGAGVSALLDRWLATRATSQTSDKVLYGTSASTAINAKSDGVRIFAQLAVGGLSAAGAYAARKKMPMLAVGLAGFAGAYLFKAGFMILTDHALPMLFKSKKAGDAGDRYFPDRQPAASSGAAGRRLMGGSPHPFAGKPARIGPVATGSVGCASCKRSGLLEPCNNCGGPAGGCSCNPFSRSPEQDCLRKVSGQTTGGCDGLCPNGGSDDNYPGDGGDGSVPGNGGNGGGRVPGLVPGGGGAVPGLVPGDGGTRIINPGTPVDGGGGRGEPAQPKSPRLDLQVQSANTPQFGRAPKKNPFVGINIPRKSPFVK